MHYVSMTKHCKIILLTILISVQHTDSFTFLSTLPKKANVTTTTRKSGSNYSDKS